MISSWHFTFISSLLTDCKLPRTIWCSWRLVVLDRASAKFFALNLVSFSGNKHFGGVPKIHAKSSRTNLWHCSGLIDLMLKVHSFWYLWQCTRTERRNLGYDVSQFCVQGCGITVVFYVHPASHLLDLHQVFALNFSPNIKAFFVLSLRIGALEKYVHSEPSVYSFSFLKLNVWTECLFAWFWWRCNWFCDTIHIKSLRLCMYIRHGLILQK